MSSTSRRDEERAAGSSTEAERRLPRLDLRVVLFTVAQGKLLIAVRNGHNACLPRGVPAPGESLDAAARRLIHSETGLREQYLEQLYTLNAGGEDPSWTVIVGYLALICSDGSPPDQSGIDWLEATFTDALGAEDRMVVEYAVVRLRAKLGYTTIAFHLLPEHFTLTELQNAYEAVLNRPLDKRNFRRRMIASEILTQTAEQRRDGSHRPAALYRFRAGHDPGAFLTPSWAVPAGDSGG